MTTINSTLTPTYSFHPHLITHIKLDKDDLFVTPPSPACIFDVLHVLPSAIFSDQYQLNDLRNILGDDVHVYGEKDLERPVEDVSPSGSLVVVRRASINVRPDEAIVIDLPLHLRYQSPAKMTDRDPDRTHNVVQVARPIIGWTCPVDVPSSTDDPRLNDPRLTFASLRRLLPPYTLHHLLPRSRTLGTFLPIPYTEEMLAPMRAYVPVGRAQDARLVEIGTYAIVVLGSVWIAWAVWEAVVRRWRWEAKGKMKKTD